MRDCLQDFCENLCQSIDVEIGAHTGAKEEFLHTVYAPFYGAPSVYALISKMAARIAYRITADTYYKQIYVS